MAKKKDKVVLSETHTDETVIDGATYHATFTPTWRTEIDCGDHATLEDAQQAVKTTAIEFASKERGSSRGLSFEWHQIYDNEWAATGNDGFADTTMAIARIVMVSK